MKNDDPRASNLFCRLFSYIPRQGEKRKREPVEDFCTEALAYLLKVSPGFQDAFVKTILELNTVKFENLKVETQSFSKVQDKKSVYNCKIDILFRCENNPMIGIEVKVGAKLRKLQLESYREAYPDAELFLLVRHFCRRDYREAAKKNRFKIISWEKVQNLLSEHSLTNDPQMAHVRNQFAEFLAMKGMKYLSMTQNPKEIRSLPDATKLIDEWNEFLEDKLSDLLFDGRSKLPNWEQPSEWWPQSSFFGIYQKGSDQYAGFRIDRDGKTWCFYANLIECVKNIKLPALRVWRQGIAGDYRIRIVKVEGSKISLDLQTQYPRPGIGKLVKQKRKAWMGFNPKTQQKIKIAAKTVVKFRVAKAAKDEILGVKK